MIFKVVFGTGPKALGTARTFEKSQFFSGTRPERSLGTREFSWLSIEKKPLSISCSVSSETKKRSKKTTISFFFYVVLLLSGNLVNLSPLSDFEISKKILLVIDSVDSTQLVRSK